MIRHIHIHRKGDGPVLVFLHGWTMTGDIFADAFDRLGGEFTCLAPDLPGHGRTEGYDVSVAGAATMLTDMLHHCKLTNVTLIGWSLGALVAWSSLARHGAQRVSAMISLDMSPRPLNGPDWAMGLRGQTAADARAKTDWFRADWPRAAGTIAATMFATSRGAPGLSVALASLRIAAQPAPMMADFWASLVECDLRATIATLPVPHLAIHGAQSRVYPAQTAHWLATHAPQGAALVLPEAGHSPILEQPEACCDAIAAFANRPKTER